MGNRSKSRKQTPWDDIKDVTATQDFLRTHYQARYEEKDLHGLADSENPLDPVNLIHCLLKMFLNAHSGFNRDELQAYLNLYAFVINPPFDHLEKIERIIGMAFKSPKYLKYRNQFKRNANA